MKKTFSTLPFVTFAIATLTALPLWAQATEKDWEAMNIPDLLGLSVKPLIILFVLAILLESALAVIFNWRLFLEFFYGRGVRTLVMIVVAAMVVWTFKIDVLKELMAAYGTETTEETGVTRFLTALILAGGSAGVYNILVALGYRSPRKLDEIQPSPHEGKAWIAIKVVREKAVGAISVNLEEIPDDPSAPMLAGSINPWGFWGTIQSVFFIDPNRWPHAGGREVQAGKTYRLSVNGVDEQKNSLVSSIDRTYRFANRAIIDFEVRL